MHKVLQRPLAKLASGAVTPVLGAHELQSICGEEEAGVRATAAHHRRSTIGDFELASKAAKNIDSPVQPNYIVNPPIESDSPIIPRAPANISKHGSLSHRESQNDLLMRDERLRLPNIHGESKLVPPRAAVPDNSPVQ